MKTMNMMTMGLLPTYKFNYRARVASLTFQGLLLVTLCWVGAAPAVQLVKTMAHVVYTPIVVDTTPKWQPSARVNIVAPVISRIVVPKPSPIIQTPVIEPPKVEIQAKATPLQPPSPALPRKPIEVGKAFATTEKPTLPKSTPAAAVQTGGFGDPNGIKGVGDGKGKLQAASLGSFGMPAGPGYGNGTGGAKGKIGVVGDAGFGGSDYSQGGGKSTGQAKQQAPAASTPLVILEHIRPQYTDEGRKLGIQGEVLLQVRFTANGGIEILKVIQGLGHGLDEQAVLAAGKIKFKPAEHGGQPIDSEATVHIIFALAS